MGSLFQCMLAMKMRSLRAVIGSKEDVEDGGIRVRGGLMASIRMKSMESAMNKTSVARRSQLRRRRPGRRKALISMRIDVALLPCRSMLGKHKLDHCRLDVAALMLLSVCQKISMTRASQGGS